MSGVKQTIYLRRKDSIKKAPTQLKDPNSHDSCPRKQLLQKPMKELLYSEYIVPDTKEK